LSHLALLDVVERDDTSLELEELALGNCLGDNLGEIHWENPNQTPHPNHGSPSPSNRGKLGPGRISINGNEGSSELGNDTSNHQGNTWSVEEEEGPGTSSKDDELTRDGNLEVDDSNQLKAWRVGGVRGVVGDLGQSNGGEETSSDDEVEEDETAQCEVETEDDCDSRGLETEGGKRSKPTGHDENVLQSPRVGHHTGLNSIGTHRHNRTIVENGNDKDEERGVGKLPNAAQEGEGSNDTNRRGTGVGGVVSHTLEDASRSKNSLDDDRETLSQEHHVTSVTGS
jgi:hypothetical protein